MRGIISCTCWKSRIRYLSTSFTGVSQGQQAETERWPIGDDKVFTSEKCAEKNERLLMRESFNQPSAKCTECPVRIFTVSSSHCFLHKFTPVFFR